MRVPFLNLRAQHAPIADELQAAIREVIESSAFAGGPYVAAFEEDFAKFCGCKFAIGVGNGTDALWFALLALGVGPGDEVITVPNTFIATAEAVSFCGATPVFVDVDERTYTMDPNLLERAITPRTKAIIPVHLYGQTADMDPILSIASKRGIPVVEDACQAHGAKYKGRSAGSLGAAGCFSFYPGKNLGALGEAGAVVTNDPEVNALIRTLRDHGQIRKYHHSVIGWNGRMDGIQGAALKIKLKHLEAGNDLRRKRANEYDEILKDGAGVICPLEADYARHVYHLYVLRIKNRDETLAKLAADGIDCGIHYPVPVHLQKAYGFMGLGPGSFPVAERCAKEIISLPMFPDLSKAQVDFVGEKLLGALLGNSHDMPSAN